MAGPGAEPGGTTVPAGAAQERRKKAPGCGCFPIWLRRNPKREPPTPSVAPASAHHPRRPAAQHGAPGAIGTKGPAAGGRGWGRGRWGLLTVVSLCAGAQARADEQTLDGGAPGDGKPAATVSATASLGFAHVSSSSDVALLQKDGRHSRDSNADALASSKDDSPSGLSARDTARAAVAGGGGHEAPASKSAEDAVRESHTPAPRRLSLMTGTLRMSESETAISERLRSVPETPRSEAELSQLPTSLSAQVGPSLPAAVPPQHMSQPHQARSPPAKRSSLSPAGAPPGGWDMSLLLENGALRHMPPARP